MDTARHDAWSAAESYDVYMGRWSRAVAPPFLDWLAAPPNADWFELGCGTGALSAGILATCDPRSLTAVEPSDGFRARAEAAVPDPRARFLAGDADTLPVEAASQDVAVSGLVLNFVPDRAQALAGLRAALRPDGLLGCYVWDYPGGGMQILDAFWRAAAATDPAAAGLDEGRRFPFCTREALAAMTADAGFSAIETKAIEVPAVFPDFDAYWHPFTLGAGPAPGYLASLEAPARERLREYLRSALPMGPDGAIRLSARAWAVKARA